MASIQRRVRPSRDGGPGEVSYRVRYRGRDGKERSKSFKRKTDAERWAATQMASIAKGEWIDPHESRVTFEEWVPQWALTLHHLRPPGMASESVERIDECLPFFRAIIESREHSLKEFT